MFLHYCYFLDFLLLRLTTQEECECGVHDVLSVLSGLSVHDALNFLKILYFHAVRGFTLGVSFLKLNHFIIIIHYFLND